MRATPLARIFFDVDDTIVTWNGRLRPFAREVLAALVERGFEVYIWSGNGVRWAVVDRHGLRPFVSDCFVKPLFRHRERLEELGVSVVPDYVIDDYVEVVDAFGGMHVPPPREPLTRDRHLLNVLADIQTRFALEPGFALLTAAELDGEVTGA